MGRAGSMCTRRSGQIGLDLVPRRGFDGEGRAPSPRLFKIPISTTRPSPIVLYFKDLPDAVTPEVILTLDIPLLLLEDIDLTWAPHGSSLR